MTTDKQIELIDELAKTLYLNYDMPIPFAKDVAEFLYEEGYRELKQGKWLNEDFPEKKATQTDVAICSICKDYAHKAEHGYSILSKFCPNCGTMMEEK